MIRSFLGCCAGSAVSTVVLLASAQGVEPVLDASQCRGTPAGEELLRALAIEGAWTKAAQPDAVPPRELVLGVRIVDCGWNNGSLVIEVHEGDANGGRHVLDLGAVPEVVRARTAAVALVEWTRSLSATRRVPARVPDSTAASPPEQAAAQASTTGPSATLAPTDAIDPDPQRQVPGRQLWPWVFAMGVGFELTHAPTPTSFRVDAALDRRLWGGVRASVAIFAAYLAPQSQQGGLHAWWWGTELALGHAWGQSAQFSLWGLTSIDGVTVSGTTRDGVEANRVTQPLVSVSVRAQMRKVFESGLALGVAVDGGGFVQGARFTALGESVAQFEGLRLGSRALIGYSF